jgi:hypothetical protein
MPHRKRATRRRFLKRDFDRDPGFATSDFIGRSPTCETPDTIGWRCANSIFHLAESAPDPRVKSRFCAEMWSDPFSPVRFSCPFAASRGSEENPSKKFTRACHMS